MDGEAPTPDPPPAPRRLPLGRRQRVWLAYIRKRWGRIAALAAISAGVVGIVGHLLGGVAGLWEFYRVAGRSPVPAHSPAVPSAKTPPFRSVAIMPFAAQGSAATADLAATLTTDITTATTRAMHDGLVLSSGLAAGYRDGPRDPRKLGADLNVRYLVLGTLRENGGARELAVELVDTVDGSQLWSDRAAVPPLDASLPAARIAKALRDAVEAATRKEVESLPAPQRDAWRLVLRVQEIPDTPEGDRESQRLLEEAVRIDPKFVPGLVMLQIGLFRQAQNEPENRAAAVKRLGELSQRAILIAPNDPRVWQWRAYALQWQQNWSGAQAAIDQALRLDPFRGESVAVLAGLQLYSGRSQEALATLQRAAELHAMPFQIDMWSCVAYTQLARDRDALGPCERAAAQWNYWVLLGHVAAAYGNLGEQSRATLWAQRMRADNPRATIESFRNLGVSEHPEFIAKMEHFREGLRKAGVPER